ncbi:hypothetical protein Tco_0756910 [Tanacetum coccineum]
MQTQESKIDTGKALDADLVKRKALEHRLNSAKMIAALSGNDTDAILSYLKSLLKVGLLQYLKHIYDTEEQTHLWLAINALELIARIQEKVFAIAALKNGLRKLKGNNVDYKFDKTSVLGGNWWLPSIRNQSVVRYLLRLNLQGLKCQNKISPYSLNKTNSDVSDVHQFNVQKEQSLDLSADDDTEKMTFDYNRSSLEPQCQMAFEQKRGDC